MFQCWSRADLDDRLNVLLEVAQEPDHVKVGVARPDLPHSLGHLRLLKDSLCHVLASHVISSRKHDEHWHHSLSLSRRLTLLMCSAEHLFFTAILKLSAFLAALKNGHCIEEGTLYVTQQGARLLLLYTISSVLSTALPRGMQDGCYLLSSNGERSINMANS